MDSTRTAPARRFRKAVPSILAMVLLMAAVVAACTAAAAPEPVAPDAASGGAEDAEIAFLRSELERMRLDIDRLESEQAAIRLELDDVQARLRDHAADTAAPQPFAGMEATMRKLAEVQAVIRLELDDVQATVRDIVSDMGERARQSVDLPLPSTPTPAPEPTATRQAQPTPTPVPAAAAPTTNTVSNLRRGPGTEFPIADQLTAGTPVQPVARNRDGTWLQLESGVWIWAQLVDRVPQGLPVASATPTPVAPTVRAQPTATPTPAAQAPAAEDAHRSMLSQLPVGNRSRQGTYDRGSWEHWVDADRDCENARAEVLIAESRQAVTYRANGCTVDTGLWVGPWGGRTFTQASDMDIDHHVPLYNAHISGGHAWSPGRKREFANDLVLASALQATENRVNRAKSAGAPDEWKPPVQASWCLYAQGWIEVKHKYGLLVTRAEKSALVSMLDTCTGQPYAPPARAVPATPRPPAEAPSGFAPPRRQGRYCNDFDSRAQYEAFYEGREKPAGHDRDRDGVYCEDLK